MQKNRTFVRHHLKKRDSLGQDFMEAKSSGLSQLELPIRMALVRMRWSGDLVEAEFYVFSID